MGKYWFNGGLMGFDGIYPLVTSHSCGKISCLTGTQIVIFNSYVKLPEGKRNYDNYDWDDCYPPAIKHGWLEHGPLQ